MFLERPKKYDGGCIMGFGDCHDMYLSKKPKRKWPQSRFEQRKEKMFGDEN